MHFSLLNVMHGNFLSHVQLMVKRIPDIVVLNLIHSMNHIQWLVLG